MDADIAQKITLDFDKQNKKTAEGKTVKLYCLKCAEIDSNIHDLGFINFVVLSNHHQNVDACLDPISVLATLRWNYSLRRTSRDKICH